MAGVNTGKITCARVLACAWGRYITDTPLSSGGAAPCFISYLVPISDAQPTNLNTMAIYTLADLPPTRARSSSIPRQYHRIAEAEQQEERFSVTDAVRLKLRLQALDHALPSTSHEDGSAVDIERIIDVCQSRPFRETVYVAGSEEFYLVVKGLSRPDLIPEVYVEAYKALLQGRHYVNSYQVTDFKKGVDPTFSEIRAVIGDIDRVCETDLQGAFSKLEMKGTSTPPPSISTAANSTQSSRSRSCSSLLNSASMSTRTSCLANPVLPSDRYVASQNLQNVDGKFSTLCALTGNSMMKSGNISTNTEPSSWL
jgi:hypothetical protein